MSCWDWEFFETAVTSPDFSITDHGPLFGPVNDFKIWRDEYLNLILETTSGIDSLSSAVQRSAGEVYTATEEVRFVNLFGSLAVASGVVPRGHNKTHTSNATPDATKEISSIHSLRWTCHDAEKPCNVIEWVDNLSDSFIWPHTDNIDETGEESRKLCSPYGEVILSRPIRARSVGRTCTHLVIDGMELFIGISRAKAEYISKPGFILYLGTPDEKTRSKIRDCLSFCLGNFLVYLGYTVFDEKWAPVAFSARSGHALVRDAKKLNGWQPAPLSLKYASEITPEFLSRMVSSLYHIYDIYGFQSIFWSYWHALAAPIHMAAAHFGSAIEAIQKAYLKDSALTANDKIVEDELTWDGLYKTISACIADANLSDAAKTMLINKAKNLNFAPQSVVTERFFTALKLEIGFLESKVWRNRNRAAHGGGTGSGNASQLIRDRKILLVMMNRILLALGDGSDYYYDYYSLGRPIIQLSTPIQNGR